ncbi:permease-like cell division protein FtsX [Sphaerisporangium sp. NPDC088356]|uniref:permease-like cell division protein FtsX n=1 Tax=Sphaerisporangium sp. NPDC088356 TaxID=3154871 RepID=UPI003414F127
MTAPLDPPATEELSFGGDPDRGPRLRAWLSAHRGPVAAGVAVVVLLGALAGGGWYLYDQSRRPLAPPAGPVPEQLGFNVELCDSDLPRRCSEEVYDIADDPRQVADAVRALPEVASVKFISKQDAYELWRRSSSQYLDPAYRTNVKPENFLNSITGTLRRSADFPRFAERVRAFTGVREVSRRPTSFWRGKADLTVNLCGNDPIWEDRCGPVTDRHVTEEQKQAIADRIRSVEGVEKIYFEDRAHALMLQKRYYPEGPGSAPPLLLASMNEAFHVKVRAPAVAERVMQAVEGLPGVAYMYVPN